MRLSMLISVALASVAPVAGQDLLTPVHWDLLDTYPFSSTGYIESTWDSYGTRLASGWLVSPSVAVSAAHPFFDRETLTWSADTLFSLSMNPDFLPEPNWAASVRVLTSYSTSYTPDETYYDSFNSDLGLAILARSEPNGLQRMASWDVANDDWAPLIHSRSEMLITGYPADPDIILPENYYRMHMTGPSNAWQVYEGPVINGELVPSDNKGIPFALVQLVSAQTAFGSSGSPLWVGHPDSQQTKASAVLVSGFPVVQGVATFYYSEFRVLDELAAEFINDGIRDSGSDDNLWPGSLDVVFDGIWPTIILPGNGDASRRWQLFRNDGTGWKSHAETDGNSYTDDTVQPGVTYIYKARRVRRDNGHEEPFTRPIRASVPGTAVELGTAIGFDGLFTTGGHAPFFPTTDGAHSGVVYSNEESWLSMEVYGPGTLVFEWSVSSEPADGSGQTRDAMELLIDGKRFSFISGETPRRAANARISAGPHTVTWRYSKNRTVDAGEDGGTLHSINYIRKPYFTALSASTNVQGGAWWQSEWFGYYHQEQPDWMYHPFLGFLYGESKDASIYLWSVDPQLGWLWTAESHYPWVYSYSSGWLYHYVESSWFYRNAPEGYIKAIGP